MYNNIALLIGNEIGDYLFQNNKMALNKALSGIKGDIWCGIHCSVYALCVSICVLLGGWRFVEEVSLFDNFILAWIIAFVTHYPIDRTAFGNKWMEFFGVTGFKDSKSLTNIDGGINYRPLFVPLLYIKVDNTLHLVLMWILYSYFGT